MPYKNIVFAKLEKRLQNDPRWYMMSEPAQLNYVRFILFASETYNKIPKNLMVIKKQFRTDQDLETIEKTIKEIRANFPKFKQTKHFYYFGEFEEKTNYIPKKELLGKSRGLPKGGVDKEEEEDKNKKKNKSKNKTFPFEEIWAKYPKPVGKKEAERHFNASIGTEKDWKDINIALKNYLASERVAKGFILNGSTFFNNYKDWVNYKEPVCPKCRNTGKYVSTTGYEIVCKCPAGKKIGIPQN